MKTALFGVALLLCATAADAQNVYRCGNAYQQEPCKGGKSVDVSPPIVDPAGPANKHVYLCRATDGNLYWMPEHCHQRGWSVERTEIVPARLSWEQQRDIARSKRAAGEQLVQDAMNPSPGGSYQQTPQQSARSAQCDQLEAIVRELDRQGRAGSQLYDLDRIRAQRLDARNQQHRMGCR